MGAGQQEEAGLAQHHVRGEVEVVVVAKQGGQHIPGQVRLVGGAVVDGGDQGPTSCDRRRQELGFESGQALGDLGPLGVPVTGVVRQRRPLDEQHQVRVQVHGLVAGSEGTVDARGERRQVHHHLVAESDQLGTAVGHVGSQRGRDHRGEGLPLVAAVGVLAEQAVLESTPGLVVRAVQVHQHVGHHHVTLVVERLA